MKVGITAGAEIFDIPAELTIVREDSKNVIVGKLDITKTGIGKISANFHDHVSSVLPGSTLGSIQKIFPADSVVLFEYTSNEAITFLFQTKGVLLAARSGKNWYFALVMNPEKLSKENLFEGFIRTVAEFACISELMFMVKSANAGELKLGSIEKISKDMIPTFHIPDAFQQYQLLAYGDFDLRKSSFGQGLRALTGLTGMTMYAFGNPNNSNFAAGFYTKPQDKIDTSLLSISNFHLLFEKSDSGCKLTAGGKLTLKFEKPISFNLSGYVSNAAFALSAASTKDTSIAITDKLRVSDLLLTIGYDKSLQMGMCGRLTTNKLSIFVGFHLVLSAVPYPDMFTFAISSTTGRLSLYNLMTEIVGIDSKVLSFLDCVAVHDFDLQNVRLKNPITNVTSEDDVRQMFNASLKEFEMKPGDAQLTSMDSGNYILTDRGRMRHYRVNPQGIVSLNTQVFVSTANFKLGDYEIKAGLFICGVLEIFKIKVRFLFEVVKGVSLIALVQVSPIELGPIFKLTKSDKPAPIKPINGGLAGQLINNDYKGASLYLNITRNNVNFYLNAKLEILSVFKFDALVIVSEGNVLIDVQQSMFGFTLFLKVATTYQKFENASFSLAIGFDTSAFLEAVKAATEFLRATAKQIRVSIDSAKAKLSEAQNKVLSLQRQIDSLNADIRYYSGRIRNASSGEGFLIPAWVAIIAAKSVAIAGVYVAIGIAYTALEVAKGILTAASAISSGVLNAVATILDTVTQLLWIKSFSLTANASTKSASIGASLKIILLGKEYDLQGGLEFSGDVSSTILSFVKNSLLGKAKNVLDSDKMTIPYSIHDSMDKMEGAPDLASAQEIYKNGVELLNDYQEFTIEYAKAYVDVYGESCDALLSGVADFSEAIDTQQNIQEQMQMPYDQEFLEALAIIRNEFQGRDTVSNSIPSALDALEDFALNCMNEKGRRNAKKASLYETYINEMDKERSAKDTVKDFSSPAEQNGMMAQRIDGLFERYFSEVKNEDFYINISKEPLVNDALNILRESRRMSDTKDIGKFDRVVHSDYESKIKP